MPQTKQINYVEALKKALRDDVAVLMKVRGYSKHGNTFYKKYPYFTKIINIQKHSTGNRKDDATCTINIAIFIPTLDRRKQDKNVPEYPKEYQCKKINYRIGQLIDRRQRVPGGDKWYSYNRKKLVHSTTMELLRDLKQYALPFLDAFSDKQNIMEFLKKNKRKYFKAMKKFKE
jgi:hypothetical protein